MRLLALILVIAGSSAAQRIGDIAPALVWDKLIGKCPAAIDQSGLNGKVVVLSFGDDFPTPQIVADWSGLAEKFPDSPVLFVPVVRGPEFLVEQALKNATWHGCVLLDRADSNRENFKISPSTGTVVIDRLGIIAGYSRYSDGDPVERAVRAVLDYDVKTGLTESPPEPRAQRSKPVDDPSWQVLIEAAKPGGPRGFVDGPDQYLAKGMPLDFILSTLWSTPPALIVLPERAKGQSYTVSAHIPVGDYELLLKLCRETVERQLGLSIDKEMRLTRTYVMSPSPHPSSALQPAGEDELEVSGGGERSILGTNQTTKDIALALQDLLGVPVVDEGGMSGKYDYSVTSKLSGTEGALDLARQLGFDLKPAYRAVEILVAKPAR